MVFLTPNDFKTVTLDSTLDKFTQENPQALEAAVDIALDEATSYLTGRYDLAAAYAASGSSRNKILVSSLVDMALYHVYSGFAPRNVPEVRGLRYQAANDLFKGVQKGTRFLQLPLLPLIPENPQGLIMYGSNPKFNY